ncbi:hypothetical protein [Martelella sp. AMO21009]
MRVFLYIIGALWLCLSALVAIAAPSDIQLTMAAVLFCSAILAFGLAALLGWAKDNAESLARIEHYLATKEEAAKTDS